jgi:hypothetical protein
MDKLQATNIKLQTGKRDDNSACVYLPKEAMKWDHGLSA